MWVHTTSFTFLSWYTVMFCWQVESCTANACGPVSQVHSGHVCRSGNQMRCCNRGSYVCMSGYRRCCNRVQSSSATSASTFIHLLPTSSTLVDPLGSPPTHPSTSQSKHSSLLIIPTHIPKCMYLSTVHCMVAITLPGGHWYVATFLPPAPTGVTLQQETGTHETALLCMWAFPYAFNCCKVIKIEARTIPS